MKVLISGVNEKKLGGKESKGGFGEFICKYYIELGK